MTENDKVPRGQTVVDKLQQLSSEQFQVWKHFEDRADRLGQRLWITGTWMMTLLAAILALPFVGEFAKFTENIIPVQVKSRLVVALIALFGMAVCAYSYSALRDIREHIEGNWRRSSYALGGEYEASWGGRKGHGWNILISVLFLTLLGFVGILTFSLLPTSLGLTSAWTTTP